VGSREAKTLFVLFSLLLLFSRRRRGRERRRKEEKGGPYWSSRPMRTEERGRLIGVWAAAGFPGWKFNLRWWQRERFPEGRTKSGSLIKRRKKARWGSFITGSANPFTDSGMKDPY